MDTTDELSHHSSNIIGLHIEDKEKERVQLRVKRLFLKQIKLIMHVYSHGIIIPVFGKCLIAENESIFWI